MLFDLRKGPPVIKRDIKIDLLVKILASPLKLIFPGIGSPFGTRILVAISPIKPITTMKTNDICQLEGGHLANKNILPALQKMFAALALSLLFLFISASLASQALGLIATLLLGLFAFMNVPGLQLYVVQLAEKFTPKEYFYNLL